MILKLKNHTINFNPRSPWGERHFTIIYNISTIKFQSTLPVGGATIDSADFVIMSSISIHAPRGGSDSFSQFRTPVHIHFNPRSPWGERRSQGAGNC